MDVSVVVPSFNAVGTIDGCLESLFRQRTRHRYEIIVVDSSRDGTAGRVCERYPESRVIRFPRRVYPGEARNEGIRASKGWIVAFTDADCIVDPGWIESIVEIHRLKPGYAVIGGAVWNGTEKSPVGIAEYLVEFNEFTPCREEGEARFLPTCNLSVKRDVFLKHGFFRDVVKGSDTLFGKTLLDRGEKIYFTPRLRVVHRNRTRILDFLRNQHDLGDGSARIRREAEMPGSFLVEKRFLIPLLPFFRFVSIAGRLLRERSTFLRHFCLEMPLLWAGLMVYAIGFYRGSSRKDPGSPPSVPGT